MELIISISEQIGHILQQRAKANGCAVTDYVENLIEKDVNKRKTLDEIFAPFRAHTEQISEEEIDGLVKKARKEIFAEKKGR